MMRKTTDKKKLRGAVLSAVVMAGLMLVFAASMAALCFGGSEDAAEIVILAVTALICLAVAVGVCIALVQRKKEIEGGEEEDAKKY